MATEERPRQFQRNVHEILMRGKNVILQAPTGAGKTRAALQPYIQNLMREEHLLPRTCLYATPMRVLSNQFYQQYHARLTGIEQQQGTDFIRLYQKLGREPISIQTGEQQDDPQFESLLTFCTIDQLLASFLGVPYSVDSRKANLNVAAVFGSYLVLDEFHLYPLSREGESCFGARTTALSMLRLLQSTTRFILMTATFSTHLLTELKRLLNAEIVSLSDDELAQIAEGRERRFARAPAALSANAVLEKHDRCSLVICNTVLRAQQMYWQIRQRVREQEEDIEVVLLHSRLTAKDRKERSEKVIHNLGQAPKEWEGEERFGWKDGQYYGKNLIVVATQVVEVGLDISAQMLHTELAPANSLIQRAGRCARFAQQKGTVIVYPLLDEQGEAISAKPYHQSLCESTWSALQNIALDQVVGFREEQELIDAVHTEEDRELLERYEKNRDVIEKNIFSSLNEHKRGVVSSLIRDVEQVHILIHDDPNGAIQEEPWCWQSFALHPDSLAGSWQALQENEDGPGWVCKQAIAVPEGDADADSRQKVRYQWEDIATSNRSGVAETLRGALMVVLPPELATYHDELGFVLLDGRLDIKSTGYQSEPLEKKKSGRPDIFIRQQSYLEHISGLVLAYNRGIRQSIQYAAEHLEDQLQVPRGSIDQAIRLALACHDIGKLSEGWQHWAWEWQNLLFQKGWSAQPPQGFFAKTDYDSHSDHRIWQRDLKVPRPPHACESVAAGVELIAESLYQQIGEEHSELFLRAVCGAIARHHTSDAQTYKTFRLKQGAQGALQEALERAKEQGTWTYSISELQRAEIKAGDLAPSTATATDPDTCITRPRLGHLGELET
ncbi:MAG TPA: CRISPR-associated helicase Cas3', partial [Ktedonobacteraceae bacterium]|nr:CRISPR-associated helicase Cas3' [Ktedonobacteraceae bacterium]